MSITLSASQTSFYTLNGFLELEEVFSPAECEEMRTTIQELLAKRKQEPFLRGRDLWRDSPSLKTLLLSRKLAGLALDATRKTSLRLACDQWFEPGYSLETPEKLEKLFSVQGIVCALILQLDSGSAVLPRKLSPLGLPPFPHGQGNILILKPTLLLNWPPLTPGMGLYAICFSFPTSVYVQNPKDPAGVLLRGLGYGYGDALRNDAHPVISRN